MASTDPSSSDSDAEDNQQILLAAANIENLQTKLSENPYDYDSHKALIGALREAALFEELRLARRNMHKYYPLSQEMWQEYIDDEKSISHSWEEKLNVFKLYHKATRDYFSISLWMEYINYSLQVYTDCLMEGSEDVTIEDVRVVFSQATSNCSYHLTEGGKIWEAFFTFEEKILEAIESPEQVHRFQQLMLQRLKMPHYDVSDTFSRYCNFITKFYPTEFENLVEEANKIYQNSLQEFQDREPYENSLINYEYSLDIVNSYVQFEKSQKKSYGNLLLRCIFERAIAIHFLRTEYWEEYISFMRKEFYIGDQLLHLTKRATQNSPWGTELWCARMLINEKFGQQSESVQASKEVLNEALSYGYLNDVEKLVRLFLINASHYCRIYHQKSTSENMDQFRQSMKIALEVIESIAPDVGDPKGTLEKFWINVEVNVFQEKEAARQLWESLQKKSPNSADILLGRINFEESCGNYDVCKQIYKQAYSKWMDSPDKVLEKWEEFSNIHSSSLDEVFDVQDKIKQKIIKIQERRDKESTDKRPKMDSRSKKRVPNKNEMNDEKVTKKRKVEEEKNVFQKPEPIVRSPEKVKEAEVGVPEPSSNFSTIAPSTVFVCNFPQSYNNAFKLRGLFEKYGEIVDIRLPHPKAGVKSRRFAYIEFTSAEMANAALELNNLQLETSFLLSVAISDTSKRKPREERDQPVNRKLLVVAGIPFSSTEVDLKSFFDSCGDIVSVRISRRANGKSKGVGFVEFSSEEDAAKGMNLNHSTMGDREISIQYSDPNYRAKSERMEHTQPTSKAKSSTGLLQLLPRQTITSSTQKPRMSLPGKSTKNESDVSEKRNNESEIANVSKSNDDFRKLFMAGK